MFNENTLPKSYKPIAKLFLPASGRVITPFPLANRQSWLDDSPMVRKEFIMDDDILFEIAELLPVDLVKKPQGRYPLAYQETLPPDEFDGIDPKAIFGRIEPNGTLSVVVLFTDGEEEIIRTGHASISTFEVEWMYAPLLEVNENPAQPHDANQ